MATNKFKAYEYNNYNKKIGLDKYKELHTLLENLFNLLPFKKNQFDKFLNVEKQYQFVYNGLNVFIDKQLKIFEAEIIGTENLPLKKKIKLHKKKIKLLSKKNVQLKLF